MANGYSLVMACLSTEASMPFYKQLISEYKNKHPLHRPASPDLSSYASVKAFADSITYKAINRLVHNAGILPKRTLITEDGPDHFYSLVHYLFWLVLQTQTILCEPYSKKLGRSYYPLRRFNIQVVSAGPGTVDTPMITMNKRLDTLVNFFFRPMLSTPARGASTTVYLATEKNPSRSLRRDLP